MSAVARDMPVIELISVSADSKAGALGAHLPLPSRLPAIIASIIAREEALQTAEPR